MILNNGQSRQRNPDRKHVRKPTPTAATTTKTSVTTLSCIGYVMRDSIDAKCDIWFIRYELRAQPTRSLIQHSN